MIAVCVAPSALEYQEAQIALWIKKHRARIGLDPQWTIAVIVDPGMAVAGSISWQSEAWEATMRISPELGARCEWVVVHELTELHHYEEADWGIKMVEHAAQQRIEDLDEFSAYRILFDQFAACRNRAIEKTVRSYLGRRR